MTAKDESDRQHNRRKKVPNLHYMNSISRMLYYNKLETWARVCQNQCFPVQIKEPQNFPVQIKFSQKRSGIFFQTWNLAANLLLQMWTCSTMLSDSRIWLSSHQCHKRGICKMGAERLQFFLLKWTNKWVGKQSKPK
jgi:hypothetical protein